VTALVWISDVQLPGKGITTSPSVTEAELRLMAGDAAHEGEITKDDQDLIERVFRFGDRNAGDIMVPRPDMVAVPISATVDQALEASLSSGHRRIPVFSETLENIIGMVRLRDLVSVHRSGGDLAEALTDPLATPESKSLTSLLSEMQAENNHLAIVIDEYGVTAGLVTVEDIAGSLIGAISAEDAPPPVTQVAIDHWEAHGSLPVDALAEFDVRPPEGDWNTLAGLMIGQAGRLLRPGDSIDVESLRLRVDSVQGRRIVKVSIFRRHPRVEPPPRR
jgi:CBS domain containing-hemolysin-like protein